MEVLVLGHDEVRALLSMAECVDVVYDALRERARGEANMPLRQVMWLDGRRGALAWMPAHLETSGALGAKVITVFPHNSTTPYDSHQGPVLLFDPEFGRLLAMVDASALTAIRTAAVSAAATRALARPGASRLGIVGTGTQALLHIDAMRTVRPIERVGVWGRAPEKAARLAERAADLYGLRVETYTDLEQMVAESDIVCTATASARPLVAGRWLGAGTHVNAIGASVPGFRELDAEAVSRSRLYVDARESALSEADEIRLAVAEGAIGESHIVGEIGDLFEGQVVGRRDDAEITVFKSCGLAVEDVAAARHVYERARERGRGVAVEFSAGREA